MNVFCNNVNKTIYISSQRNVCLTIVTTKDKHLLITMEIRRKTKARMKNKIISRCNHFSSLKERTGAEGEQDGEDSRVGKEVTEGVVVLVVEVISR